MKDTAEIVVNRMMGRLKRAESQAIQEVERAFTQALMELDRDLDASRAYIERETLEWLRRMSDTMTTQYNFQIMMAKWEEDDKASND